mmetsp:Transcript_104002/g.335351  ORF Transcript_104002/g.335351 Transcript_104002/m.335351 type:complete len:260 (+) Transcript_104002:257-1036(+)
MKARIRGGARRMAMSSPKRGTKTRRFGPHLCTECQSAFSSCSLPLAPTSKPQAAQRPPGGPLGQSSTPPQKGPSGSSRRCSMSARSSAAPPGGSARNAEGARSPGIRAPKSSGLCGSRCTKVWGLSCGCSGAGAGATASTFFSGFGGAGRRGPPRASARICSRSALSRCMTGFTSQPSNQPLRSWSGSPRPWATMDMWALLTAMTLWFTPFLEASKPNFLMIGPWTGRQMAWRALPCSTGSPPAAFQASCSFRWKEVLA